LIADLRLLPHEKGIASLCRPRQIGPIADVALKNIAVESRGKDILQENWPSIVSKGFCSHCFPITILPSDVLIIGCRNTVIRSELELIKPMILANISALPRCKYIGGVRFRPI